MAIAKRATVIATREVGPDTRLLALECAEPLGFVGGQYLIFDSGVVLDGGKLAKRAYSILSGDAEQRRIEVAVKRIGDGPGSSFMHRARPGDELPFSGPWGKYLPDDATPRSTWVIATDTGVSCALGLVAGARFAPQRARAELRWLVADEGYFLPEPFVRERAPFRVARARPVGDPERFADARALVDELFAQGKPDSVFLSGDGQVIFPLRDHLAARGVDPAFIRTESYFHHEKKKSA